MKRPQQPGLRPQQPGPHQPAPRRHPSAAKTSRGPLPQAPSSVSQAEIRARNVSPARRLAFEILTLVAQEKGHSDELLHTRPQSLSPEDRNLATALVMGVLRWQIALDATFAPLLARPGQAVPQPVSIALRMGAFQLLQMDRIPPHAALNESVELCRLAGQPQAAGMVNAILRKISTAPAAPAAPRLHETLPQLAQRLAHPAWLVERWAAQYGRAAALAICEYDQHEPDGGSLFLPPPPEAPPLPAIDQGSRLVAELTAASAPAAHDIPLRVWDACAAPGGKTLLLAARLPSASILATDISPRRLEATRRRLTAGPSSPHAPAASAALTYAVADASNTSALPPATLFDLILCDVPCSGTGTLARNPEIRLKLKPEELARQAARQRAILSGALARLAPGGRLVYSTCSLEPEENEQVLGTLAIPGIRLLPVQPLLQSLAERALLSPAAAELLLASAVLHNTLRTLPGTHPCDGFFAAVFERI